MSRDRHPEDRRAASLTTVPINYKLAAAFIEAHHRHNAAPQGWKFGVGVSDGKELVGVATAGRPVARHFDDGLTVEITRTCTLGHPNANSMLYGALCRAAFALGYVRVITYTQGEESGGSLRACGFRVVAQRPARSGWSTPARLRTDARYLSSERTLWEADRES